MLYMIVPPSSSAGHVRHNTLSSLWKCLGVIEWASCSHPGKKNLLFVEDLHIQLNGRIAYIDPTKLYCHSYLTYCKRPRIPPGSLLLSYYSTINWNRSIKGLQDSSFHLVNVKKSLFPLQIGDFHFFNHYAILFL